jgi:SnoaL-like domain
VILRWKGESTTVEIWELVVRERIRDTLARYNWSGDAGRLDDLADTFTPDGWTRHPRNSGGRDCGATELGPVGERWPQFWPDALSELIKR